MPFDTLATMLVSVDAGQDAFARIPYGANATTS